LFIETKIYFNEKGINNRERFVGASFEQPVGTGEVIRQMNPKIKFYQASTSELYERGHCSSLSEDSPFQPASPYSGKIIWFLAYKDL